MLNLIRTSGSSRARGLKFQGHFSVFQQALVGLFASPWIEIKKDEDLTEYMNVGLFASPWIEIVVNGYGFLNVAPSGSSRARGLKYQAILNGDFAAKVGLFASPWIEIRTRNERI